MSKDGFPNITSPARQENLYATYRTTDNEFWSNLAKESQQEFKRSGTEGKCIEARELLDEPEVKTAARSIFFDEAGERVRTKKEIMGEDGQIRKGCTVIKKGEVYESHLFTAKDVRFKGEPFLREVKGVYTSLINLHISDPEQQLKVFDKNSVYLPTKKIGKNNPKAAEIKADNAARQEWKGQRTWRCYLVFPRQRF